MATIRAELSSPTLKISVEVQSADLRNAIHVEERIREFLTALLTHTDPDDETSHTVKPMQKPATP
ncbi:hypothetical protein GCM10023170_096370 [Phytohabitans houttuyneae]|uniref:Uncharacterized protein n=1 Tax=Phytohabitans houttuyneae TaxID=1076126 RepID=A0A6V8K5J7_9ACTN|nr:hypothetical protein Phou_016090 [Phytohabitans houttuyneae]